MIRLSAQDDNVFGCVAAAKQWTSSSDVVAARLDELLLRPSVRARRAGRTRFGQLAVLVCKERLRNESGGQD